MDTHLYRTCSGDVIPTGDLQRTSCALLPMVNDRRPRSWHVSC